MRPTVIYTIPSETKEVWDLFKAFVDRFFEHIRRHQFGVQADICLHQFVLRGVQNQVMALTEWIPNFFPSPYFSTRSGADIGALQEMAQFYKGYLPNDRFIIFCNARVYPYRDGWLKKIVEAREIYGPGLYATACSREGGKLHTCCRCFGIDASIMQEYPHEITSRDQGQFFESGDGCLYEWVKSKWYTTKVVYWDGVYPVEEFDQPNAFRRGNQSNCLVKDKHIDTFNDASPEEKERLTKLCYGT